MTLFDDGALGGDGVAWLHNESGDRIGSLGDWLDNELDLLTSFFALTNVRVTDGLDVWLIVEANTATINEGAGGRWHNASMNSLCPIEKDSNNERVIHSIFWSNDRLLDRRYVIQE